MVSYTKIFEKELGVSDCHFSFSIGSTTKCSNYIGIQTGSDHFIVPFSNFQYFSYIKKEELALHDKIAEFLQLDIGCYHVYDAPLLAELHQRSCGIFSNEDANYYLFIGSESIISLITPCYLTLETVTLSLEERPDDLLIAPRQTIHDDFYYLFLQGSEKDKKLDIFLESKTKTFRCQVNTLRHFYMIDEGLDLDDFGNDYMRLSQTNPYLYYLPQSLCRYEPKYSIQGLLDYHVYYDTDDSPKFSEHVE